jgi:hypothetical protein
MTPTIHQEWARARSADLYRRAERERMALAAIAHPATPRAVASEMVPAARRPRKQQAEAQMLTVPVLARRLLTLLRVRRLRPARRQPAEPGTPQPGAPAPLAGERENSRLELRKELPSRPLRGAGQDDIIKGVRR